MRDNIKFTIPGLDALKEDEGGVLRMPFNVADYGDDNKIKRICYECEELFEQGQMKELSIRAKDAEMPSRVYGDRHKMYDSSIFYCKLCWLSTSISDASKWMA